MKNLPKEDKQKEEEEPCTSYSHQGDKEISRRNTPSFGEEKWDKLTKLLPKYVYMIHEEFKEIRRNMYGESPRGIDSKAKSRFEECEHAATHPNTQRSHMPMIAGREMEIREEVVGRETLSDFLKEYESQTQKFKDHLSFFKVLQDEGERKRVAR